MNTIKLTLLLLTSIFLFGCASGAKMENMVYTSGKLNFANQLENNVDVSSVTGGKKTNPAWKSEIDNESFLGALEKSLLAQGLLSQNGRYSLEAKIIKVDQPWFGFDIKVVTQVQYLLKDTATNSVVFNESVFAPYTATIGDAYFGIKRLRLANEGAGKKNIEALLNKLSELKIKQNEISLAN